MNSMLMFHTPIRTPRPTARENTTDSADPNDVAIMKAADAIAELASQESTIIAIASTDSDFLEAWSMGLMHPKTSC